MVKFANALTAVTAPSFPVRLRPRQFDIPKNHLFSSLSRQQARLILPYLKLRRFKPGRPILEEGKKNPGKIYIIVDGQVSISKLGVSPLENGITAYELGVLRRGDVLGEASFVDGKPSPASFVAKSDVSVAVVDLSAADRKLTARRLRNIVVKKLRRHLASQASESAALRVNSLRMENELAAYRNGVGHIVVTTLCLLSMYTLALSLLPSFRSVAHSNFTFSPLVIFLCALSFAPVIATSGLPLSFFGLRLDNWRSAMALSLRASAIFLAVFLCVKLILIHASPAFGELSLFDNSNVDVGGNAMPITMWYWIALFAYIALTPMQEFMARSGIQAPLYAFLQGSEAKRRWCSIMASNLVFSAAHAHISLAFALAAFLPGLLWGWIFAKTNSLLAATVSHLLVGGAAIFLFGIEGMVAKLAA